MTKTWSSSTARRIRRLEAEARKLERQNMEALAKQASLPFGVGQYQLFKRDPLDPTISVSGFDTIILQGNTYDADLYAQFCSRSAFSKAHIYAIVHPSQFWKWENVFSLKGWKVFETPLIASFGKKLYDPWPGKGPTCHYKAIMFASQGDKSVNSPLPDVIPIRNYKELLQNLFMRSVLPGDSIVDLHCQEGEVFEVAQAFRCQATGFESSAQSFPKAAATLHRLQNPPQNELPF